MTPKQIDFILDCQYDYADQLQEIFPEVDWKAERARRDEMNSARWASQPNSGVDTTKFDAIMRDTFVDGVRDMLNNNGPLRDFLKKP